MPGGATEALDHLQITDPASIAATFDIHKRVFAEAGQSAAFSRIIALVVQPGAEFGHADVVHYAPEKARGLSSALTELRGMVFEAHSTDCQTEAGLRQLVTDGVCILKVDPWLTFARREALYCLDAITDVLDVDGHPPRHRLMATLEVAMQSVPGHWAKHYHSTEHKLWLQRHFSCLDRIRDYSPDPAVETAVRALRSRLVGRRIPAPLLGQYLPALSGAEGGSFDDLLLRSVERVLGVYMASIRA